MSIKHPEVKVQLEGVDGNAFSIMGAVAAAMRRAGVPAAEITQYREESMSGDYDNLLQTAFRWVDVTGSDLDDEDDDDDEQWDDEDDDLLNPYADDPYTG